MCPLIAAPNRGYSDYQRISNYDSGSLFSFGGVTRNASIASGIFDVSRFGYLGGTLQESQSQCDVLLQWFLDANGTITVAQREFILSSLIPARAQIRLPNLGPFCQQIVSPVGGVNYTCACQLFATNRVHPLEFIPRNAIVVDQQNASLGASANVGVYPNDYYAGPVGVWFECGQNAAWAVETLLSNNVWDVLFNSATIAGATNTYTEIVTPPGAWRAIVGNSTAVATTFNLAFTPTTTGST
jgi:hypothetical protein